MISKSITVAMKDMTDAEPIALLVQTAGRYTSSLHIKKGTKNINAKSIMGMMAMGLSNGDTVEIEADGADAAEALEAIVGFLTK